MEREEIVQLLEDFKGNIFEEIKGMGQPQPPQQEREKEEVSMPPVKGKDAELVSQIVAALEAKNKTSAQQVYQTMFNERVSTISTQYPAFGEYLQSKDDFGDVILDRVNKIEDYSERVQALERLFKSFAAAQSSTSQDMRLSKATKKQVEDDTSQRDSVKEKFLKGEIGLEEFTDQYFKTVENQIERIKQGK